MDAIHCMAVSHMAMLYLCSGALNRVHPANEFTRGSLLSTLWWGAIGTWSFHPSLFAANCLLTGREVQTLVAADGGYGTAHACLGCQAANIPTSAD